jgi:GNAT superfamily N-acetyltransferase
MDSVEEIAALAYSLRLAVVEDIPVLARHRRLMFEAMGRIGGEDSVALEGAVQSYLRQALPRGTYAGWVVELGGDIVASGGVQLRELVPRPGYVDGNPEAVVLSMWTEPAHRRRGLGSRILESILAWCREKQAHRIVLYASADGRPLYELFGFTAGNEMRLDLEPGASVSKR